ncbi:hypothetical protein [Streptomyces parvulus]|uniref:hypothetical protein n=1 Tax=Streptomyces parvulus TaxID=146923 RepID=UPI0036C1A9D8
MSAARRVSVSGWVSHSTYGEMAGVGGNWGPPLCTGMTLDRWSDSQRSRRRELLESGSFPLLSAFTDDTAPDLDLLFEYGLARHPD